METVYQGLGFEHLWYNWTGFDSIKGETWFIFWIYTEVKDSYFFVSKSMNIFFNCSRKQTVYYKRLMSRMTNAVCCHRDCVSYSIPFFWMIQVWISVFPGNQALS